MHNCIDSMIKADTAAKDTMNTESCPREVHISAGLDVLFHSMESYTAIPYVYF